MKIASYHTALRVSVLLARRQQMTERERERECVRACVCGGGGSCGIHDANAGSAAISSAHISLEVGFYQI